MKSFFLFSLSLFSILSLGQDKTDLVIYSKLTEVKGTDFVIAGIQNWGKLLTTDAQYLLFINTRNGSSTQIDFSKDAYIQSVEQIRLDSLNINVVIVVGMW